MRNIKFRAWEENEKIMIYSDSGNILSHGHGLLLNFNGDLVAERKIEENSHKMCFARIGYSLELMQCMGTKDYSGKELYEHDIVKMRDYLYVVEYKWYFLGYSPSWTPINLKEGESMCSHKLYIGEYHIVGNIHEHPHLLNNERAPTHLSQAAMQVAKNNLKAFESQSDEAFLIRAEINRKLST